MHVEQFEPVYLEPGPAQLTEYGKRWMLHQNTLWDKFRATLADVAKFAAHEKWEWPELELKLSLEGCPTAITSGLSQYAMPKVVNLLIGNTAFTLPTTIGWAVTTTAPTSATTGATLADGSMYTSYGEVNITADLSAAVAGATTTATNGTQFASPNCTGSTSTLLGFGIKDGITVGSGNVLWYGTLPSTVISVTQTPPTVAVGALTVSVTGT